MNSTATVPARPQRSFRRRVTRTVLLVVCVAVATLYLFEWSLRTFDVLGVNYPEETLRYPTDVVFPTWERPDGSYDLDGTLIRNQPSVDVQFGSFRVITNALGNELMWRNIVAILEARNLPPC